MSKVGLQVRATEFRSKGLEGALERLWSAVSVRSAPAGRALLGRAGSAGRKHDYTWMAVGLSVFLGMLFQLPSRDFNSSSPCMRQGKPGIRGQDGFVALI